MTTALLPRPIIDPNSIEWLAELDDAAALLELENRLEPLSRYMAPRGRYMAPMNRYMSALN